MFTGIVEEVGRVVSIDGRGAGTRVAILCDRVLEDASLGASIAIDGCCVTITEFDAGSFRADLTAETLRVTALGELTAGAAVNLERPLALGARLGGHLVQGHVDAVGRVAGRAGDPGAVVLSIEAPAEVMRYVVPKGSITVQGVSLTVVAVTPDRFEVALIPHTLEATTLGTLAPGVGVNLEVDVVAKYVERLIAGGAVSPYAGSPSGGAGATMAAS